MINVKKIAHISPKKNYINRQQTYNKNLFIYLDKDISEMDVNIKQYQTLIKKNAFLDNEKPIKPINNLKIKINRAYTDNFRNYDCHSITTNSSYKDKYLKKVTFSNVEIIRIEKYKRYNAMNNYPKEMIQKNLEEAKNYNNDDSSCFIF